MKTKICLMAALAASVTALGEYSYIRPDSPSAVGTGTAPDVKTAFESLVPQYVIGMLYGCITSGKYTEHLERMRAMNAATENANELLDELKLNYNKARQEKITTELTELSGGFIDN